MANQPRTDSHQSNGTNGDAAIAQVAQPAPVAPAAGKSDPIAGLEGSEFGVLRNVPMTVQVEVGRIVMTLGEILDELEVGTSIRLDRHAGDPVEVYVNGTLFARAEVVVVQDQIGAKIIELVDPVQALRPSGLR
jgi:flagellar motor switch protein FliN/FliY